MFHLSNSKNMKIFFKKIKFDKNSYNLYSDILIKNKHLNNYFLAFLICQAAQQLSFDGTFHDLYFDIVQNRSYYIKQINKNFKTSYLYNENFFILIPKYLFLCGKSEKEKTFNEYILGLELEKKFDDNFVGDDVVKIELFVTICGEILSQKAQGIRINRIFPIG